MEFNFNVNELIKDEYSIITNDLVPQSFVGDYRTRMHCASKISVILDEVGIASAKAQGLQRPITSGQKHRNSDYILYLLTDPNCCGGKGCVIGLLKIGRKKLFMFDSTGYQHEVEPLCVLDFYIHESQQRTGRGKKLFEHMLQHQNVLPQHLAIDKPSEKFLSFLMKHYNLSKIIPQMNNFVIFEGFFECDPGEETLLPGSRCNINNNHIVHAVGREHSRVADVKQSTKSSDVDFGARVQNNRFSAPKPESTMGLILQDSSVNHGIPNAINGSKDCHTGYKAADTQEPLDPLGPVNCFQPKNSNSPVPQDKTAYRHTRLW